MRKQDDIWTSEYIQKTRRRKVWQKIVSVLGCVVVFCTTYALILPAITQEGEAYCGMEEHTHTDDCYAAVETLAPELICTLEEAEAHTHTEECYLPVHTHTDECFETAEPELTCGQEEGAVHTHSEACYGEEVLTLTCTQAETEGHTHTDDCYTITPASLSCTLEECEGHTHSETCYGEDGSLVCGLEESEGHTHGDGCYTAETTTLTCGQEEAPAHTHDETCYVSEGKPLICTITENEPHTHTDACYTTPEPTLICTLGERETEELCCGLEETEGHTHTDSCYAAAETVAEPTGEPELICGLEEHTHERACYSNPKADLESASDWEKTLPAELSGVWTEDILEIARSQLGYAESKANYIVDGDGSTRGYTRYGEWYGDPYGDWCAMFVSFCIHYAEVEDMPLDSNCQQWIGELTEAELYVAAGGHTPAPGEVIFFDMDGDGFSHHVGIVETVTEATEETEAKITVIEGNSSDRVQRVTYSLTSEKILGYAQLPWQPSEEEQIQIDSVIAMIDEMPSADEIDAKMAEYGEAEDYEGLESWYTEVVQQVAEAYYCYSVLSDNQKTLVTNADKLLELEYIWSAHVLIDEITSDAPTAISSASTKEFINLNLYDYNSSINANYNSNNSWPGFQWNGGAYNNGSYTRRKIDYIDFGNSMITDRDYAGSGNGKATTAWNIGNQGGNINAIVEYPDGDYANKPVGMSTGTEVLERNLTTAGYPGVTGAGSMVGYFSNSAFATKKNTESIDGLFQINETSGEYYYNSRWNHAQYSSNKFTLYEDIITPNFITYPFGNFLPFNDITNSSNATQVGAIGDGKMGDYVQEVINDLVAGTEDATEQQLIDMLAMYRNNLKSVSTTGGTAWTTWSAKDAIYDYIGNGPTDDTGPITDALLEKMYNIDWDVDTNFFFGMTMEMNFMQPKDGYTGKDNGNNTTGKWATKSDGTKYLTGDPDGESDYPMVFYFTGDDDVWVYIDGVLFLDLSGIHRHVGGKIDFVNGKVYYYALDTSTGDVSTTAYKTYTFAQLLTAAGASTDGLNSSGTFADYTTHNFKFFYMERGSGSSVCRLNFNFPLLRQNSISVQKEVSADTDIKGDPDYKFQVLKADSSGNKTSELFIAAGTTYTIYDASDKEIGTGTTDANGVFILKAGQRAEFTGIKENAGKYYVRELLDGTVLGQYGNVTVSGESTTTSNNVTVGSDTFTGMDSPVKDMSDGATSFRFTNDVDEDNLGELNISKKLTEYNETRDVKYFNIEVTLDGELLPVGTEYTVDGVTRTVETSGIITIAADETATISKILAGTQFTVQETSGSAEGYTVSYKEESDDYEITVTDGKVVGVIKTSATVQLVVTNAEKGTTVTIPGTKTIANPDGTEHTYTFRLDEVTDETGETLQTGGITNYEAKATVTNSGGFNFTINYVQAAQTELPAQFYYRITENDAADSLTNSTVYVVEVTVEADGDNIKAHVSRLWMNGSPVNSDVYTTEFVNTLASSLTIEKTVDGGTQAQSQGFTFTITLEGDNLPSSYPAVFYQQDGTTVPTTVYPNEEGNIVLNGFKHGERAVIRGVPYGTKWTITESGNDGYKVTTGVTAGETTTAGEGSETSGEITMDGTVVSYTNAVLYELPETGGAGTIPYTMAGLGLIALALSLMYITKKRRKEGSFS